MPTYSYRCEACGNEFERVQRISEDPLKECPACGQPQAKRQITSGNFILKGGGWYSDLYSGGSNKKSGGSTASSTSTGSTASTASSTSSSSDSAASSSASSSTSSTSTASTSTPTASAPSAAAK